MSEDRFPGDLREANSSSFKVALTVAGVAAGLALVLCGGVAGYVAWKDVEQPQDESNASAKSSVKKPRMSPAAVQAIAHKIVEIDIPADFEPIDGEETPLWRQVALGRKSADGALLKLRRVELSMLRPGADPRSDEPMLMRMTDGGDERTSTEIRDPAVSSRELTVIGNKVTFHFLKGKHRDSERSLWKVGGAFTAGKGFVALIYTIPEKDYDEDAVVRMIESIRAPEGESADKPNTPTSPPNVDASGTDSERTGNRPQDDAQPTDGETPGRENERSSSGQ